MPITEKMNGERNVSPISLMEKLYGGPKKICEAPIVNNTIHVTAVMNTTQDQSTIGDPTILRAPRSVFKIGMSW